jgi:cytochrome c553
LVSYRQHCNAADGGCTTADLFTPGVERDWLSTQVHDDEELRNTPQDCRQCHARGAESAQLLMRELQSPWTHFFQPVRDTRPPRPEPGVTGVDLTDDYLKAKGDEPYANVPIGVMRSTSPVLLQDAVGPHQPLLFDSQAILNERWPARAEVDADGGVPTPQQSPTWEQAFAAFKRGEQLPLPYVEPRATDPQKQARLSEAYARYRRGELQAEPLPDLSDIFPDDPVTRARIGLQTEPDATPVDALIQACGSCHNDVLDQNISRARFNIDLSKLDRAELDRAIERISLPADAEGVMPPVEARQLDPGTRERLLAYLRVREARRTPEPALQRAAQLGMAGGRGEER